MQVRQHRSPTRSAPAARAAFTIAAFALVGACASDDADTAATTTPPSATPPSEPPSTTASTADDTAPASTAPSTSAPSTSTTPATTADEAATCPTLPEGRLLAIADADMTATAYTDFQLGEPQPGVVDSLSIIDPAEPAQIVGQVEAPNAVTGPVWVFDTSPDGRLAYVIETTQPNDGTLTTFQQLFARQGTRLTTIDLCAESGPEAVDTIDTAIGPTTVSASADGELLAVAHRADLQLLDGVDPNTIDFNAPTPEQVRVDTPAGVVLHDITDDGVGPPRAMTLPAELLGDTNEVTQAIWSPDGNVLAVSVRSTRMLGFFTRTDGDGSELEQWGNLVPIDEGTFGGIWSPDGRSFLVNNVRGASRPADQQPTDIADFLGSLQVVQVAEPGTPAEGAVHELIQTESTPIFPEGVAVSPDGQLVATVNMQTTALPPANPLFNPSATVSLWTRDTATGALTKVSDYPFEGILPEGVDFDPTGNRLAVATYENTVDRTSGSVDIWAVDRTGPTPALTLDTRVVTPRGTHHVVWLS